MCLNTHVACGLCVCLQHSRSVWRTKVDELNALHFIASSSINTPNRPATHTLSHTLTHTHTHSLSVCLVHFAQSSESDRPNAARPTDHVTRSTCSTHACSARPPRSYAALLLITAQYRHAQVQEVCEEDEARSGAHSHCRALPPTGHLVLA